MSNNKSGETSATNTVFQSGETVLLAGKYEAVGVSPQQAMNSQEPSTLDLNKGELFPNYQGRSVSWRLVTSQTATRA